MALYKVYTRDQVMFPRRRRAGHEFTPVARTIDLEGEAEKSILADDALVAIPLAASASDSVLTAELASTAEDLANVRLELAHERALREAAFARLTEHGIELGDLAIGAGKADAGDFGAPAAPPESGRPHRRKSSADR